MVKYLTNIDLAQNQLIRARIDNQASDPSGSAGQIYYNTGSQVLKFYNGTVWVTLSATASSVTSLTATAPLTANATSGTAQTGAVTIAIPAASGVTAGSMSSSDFTKLSNATATNTNSTLVLRDGSGNFASNVITAVGVTISGSVVNPTDAATKSYVDGVAQGLDVKNSVRVATTGAIAGATYTATGGTNSNGQFTTMPNSIDGSTLVVGDRVLVKDQASGASNGIYSVTTVGTGANGVWDRASDFNTSAEVTAGAFTFVEEGTVNDNSGWVLATNNPITLGGAGGTSLSFVQFSGAGSIIAGNGLTKSGNTLSVVGTTNRISVGAGGVDIDASYVGQASITTLGTVTTGTWSATTIAVNKGGTGLTTYTSGNLIYANGSTSLTVLAPNVSATKQFLSMTSSTPAWGVLVNTDVPAFTGATGGAAGTLGGVPQPSAGQQTFFLRGDSTWQAVTVGTVTSVAIGSTNGGNTLLQVTNPTTTPTIDFVTTPTGNTVLASPAGGGSGAPLFRSLVNGDLPVVGVPKGGTGLSTITTNGVIYGNAGSNVGVTAAGSQYQVLQAGAGAVPVFGALNLSQAAAITGTLPLGNGGTNATTASGARTQLASDITGGVIPVKVAFNLGDGSTTAITVTHNLANRDLVASLALSTTPWDVEYADVTFPTTNTATITFNTAPTTNAYRLTLIG
jgi:hypothetical protein